MRRLLVLPAIGMFALFAACGDDSGSGGDGGAGGSTTSASTTKSSSSSTTGGSTTTSSTTTTTTTTTTTSTTTATTTSGMGGMGGMGGEGGMMQTGETNCIDGLDDDNDTDVDCDDADCAEAAVCGTLVINEVDYENPGDDDFEFVEIYNAGTTTVDLSTVSIELVNGNQMMAVVYGSELLTGTLAPGEYAVVADAGVVVDPAASVFVLGNAVQNGSPDGLALFDSAHNVVLDALAYEGSMPAADINGTMVPLVEGTATAATDLGEGSLARIPNGSDTNDASVDWLLTTIVTPGSANQLGEICDNGADDDNDTFVDCLDSDCTASPLCLEVCDDGMDNNQNMLVDCAEGTCSMQSCGPNGVVCMGTTCACPGGMTETACGDTVDDDCDGQVDCADTDCAAACAEICTDNVDNNGDNLVDCADPLCNNQSCGANGLTCTNNMCVCPGGTSESACSDSQDNDCDGQTDCADSDCSGSCAPSNVWINELHYDNAGTDADEGVEIAGPAGTNLAGYSVVFYNGGTGTSYLTTSLTGVIPDQQNGFGTLWFPVAAGIQNGSPDALALVSPSNVVMFFLGYEGTFSATNGPASGQTCVDIGVSQDPAPAIGTTLQLTGTGGSYASFTWTSATQTRGLVNSGQTLQ